MTKWIRNISSLRFKNLTWVFNLGVCASGQYEYGEPEPEPELHPSFSSFSPGCRSIIETNHHSRIWLNSLNPGRDYQSPVFESQSPWIGERGDYQSQPNGIQMDYQSQPLVEERHITRDGQWSSWTKCSYGVKYKTRYKREKQTLSCNGPPVPKYKNPKNQQGISLWFSFYRLLIIILKLIRVWTSFFCRLVWWPWCWPNIQGILEQLDKMLQWCQV